MTRTLFFALFLMLPQLLQGQPRAPFTSSDYTLLEMRIGNHFSDAGFAERLVSDRTLQPQQAGQEEYPDPSSVLFRSMMIPGWGQIINRQGWKVPLIYAIFAGVGYYNYTLTQQYHDYRAAYYNAALGAESDFKFGPTPNHIPPGMGTAQLRQNRDTLRNQRDFSYVIMAMAYGLNLLDAYVFAHMRSFDVSDDLSANTRIGPAVLGRGMPGVNVRVELGAR